MDFKGFIEGSCKLLIADTQFEFGFFLHGKLFREEVGQDFWCSSVIGGVKGVKSNGRGFEWQEILEMSDLTEGFKVGNLRLNRVDGSVDLIELFKLEESVSDWTFVQDEEYHVYFC